MPKLATGDAASQYCREACCGGGDGPEDRYGQFQHGLTQGFHGFPGETMFTKAERDMHDSGDANDGDQRVQHRADHAELHAAQDEQRFGPDQCNLHDD